MDSVRCVRDICEQIDPVPHTWTSGQVYELFSANVDLMVLAVVNGAGDVLGIVERQDFNLKLAASYGRALYAKRSITILMNAEPLMADVGAPLTDFTLTNLRSRPSAFLKGFVATENGRFWGVGTSMSIIGAITDDLQASLEEKDLLTEDLIRVSADGRRNEKFLQTVVQNIPAMVIVKTAVDGKVILMNRAAETILNVHASDVIGKSNAELYTPDRAARFDSYDQRALNSPGVVIFEDDIFKTSESGDRELQVMKTVVRSDDGESDLLVTLGTDMTAQKRAEAQIARLAHYDSLTGLANRTLFTKELDRALDRARRQSRQLALLYLDLDRFKDVNDTLGHAAGDQLLIQVAARLRECTRKSDMIARLGGDEFAVIQEIEEANDTQHLASRIIAALKRPFAINDKAVDIGVSIGAAISPDDGHEGSLLCARADMAMYRVKSSGRNDFRFYRSQMDEDLHQRLSLENDLKIAITHKQFELHFQPLMDMASGEVVSFEALIRWRHPVRGLVPPLDFIPIAEECGLIGAIGEWVIADACRAAASWPTPWRIAVNISPVQFRHKSLVRIVKSALTKSGLPAQRLELEITEGVLLKDEQHNLTILRQLRGLGVRIAMDDFGTGYSSLSYLRTFPFDKIKIDQSFVRDLPDDQNAASIIKAIADMAGSLGVTITAEGVETAAQMSALRAMNIREAQGFLIGRPALEVEPYDGQAKRWA